MSRAILATVMGSLAAYRNDEHMVIEAINTFLLSISRLRNAELARESIDFSITHVLDSY